MLLTVMVFCAVGVVVLLCREVFSDLLDAWSHPEHKSTDEDSRLTKHRPK
jgi:hypothetical protein